MDLGTFEWLLSAEGQALLAAAEAGDLGEAGRLAALERLRRLASPERAAAAFEVARARRRAAAKFPDAARMYFTRDALEQASGATIAAHRAGRYARLGARRVADLCCGAGGDTLALAAAAPVVAVDMDPLRLAMAAANAAALGLAARVAFAQLDLEAAEPPAADAIFFDPGRREGGRRIARADEYRPPVGTAARWRHSTPAVGIKLAPGVGEEELAALGPGELELISVGGELKEAALWLGPLGRPGRRATLLAGGAAHTMFLPAGEAPAPAPLAEPGRFLYEPDPAVIRAGLVGPLAIQVGAAQVDRSIAYLTADEAERTPFARCWRVVEWMPFALKRLRARLRALGAGAVTVKKRGSPLEADALARQLSGQGARPLVVALTFVAGRPAALICEGPVDPGAP